MDLQALAARLRAEIGKVVFGQEDAVRLLLAGLFAGGHVLLEGMPGTAKTMLARALGAALDMRFARVQMTPDLLPGDITGSSLYREDTREFVFSPGAVFCNFLLVDEINRASAKTQSALLEAMQELAVTADGVSHPLPEPFMVFATQNPVEQEGTYPLPLAQLDRFMFKVAVGYPDGDSEERLYRESGRENAGGAAALTAVEKVLTPGRVLEARAVVADTFISAEVAAYVRRLLEFTRTQEIFASGASPRAGLMLLAGAKSLARFAGRDFVTPDDVKECFLPAVGHRITLNPVSELEGLTPEDAMRQTLESVEVPR